MASMSDNGIMACPELKPLTNIAWALQALGIFGSLAGIIGSVRYLTMAESGRRGRR